MGELKAGTAPVERKLSPEMTGGGKIEKLSLDEKKFRWLFNENAMAVEKTAEGLQAIRWFKEGKLMEIAEYCCYDVKLTKMVHEHGVRHRQLHYSNRFGKKLTVPVKWEI